MHNLSCETLPLRGGGGGGGRFVRTKKSKQGRCKKSFPGEVNRVRRRFCPHGPTRGGTGGTIPWRGKLGKGVTANDLKIERLDLKTEFHVLAGKKAGPRTGGLSKRRAGTTSKGEVRNPWEGEKCLT